MKLCPNCKSALEKSYVIERPLDIYSSALGGSIFSSALSKIPSVTIASKTIGSKTIKSVLGLGLGVLYE